MQPSTSAVVKQASRLVDLYPLGAHDALQLGGCLVVSGGSPNSFAFVCADDRLCDAASGEGRVVLNPIAP